MLVLVRIWILLSALLVATGWVLSVFHALNRTGYLLVLSGTAGLLAVLWRPPPAAGWRAGLALWHRSRRRAWHPLPATFFLLAVMTLLEGLCYIPTNVDSNGYRIPRILHWLAEHHWHWIHTLDQRMNIAGCGYEWLAAPLLLFTHSDRPLFLVNWCSYLLLPGLVFSVFTRLGVRPRVAWWWMWLLPTGWCFVFQAASTVNDSFAAVHALAAVDFALRLRQNPRPGDFWLAALAAALLTGAKQTAMPLALLWLIAVWPARRLAFARWPVALLMAAVCLLVSGVPIMLLNHHYAGTWSGMPRVIEKGDCFWLVSPLPSPFWGFVGNLFCVPLQNLAPPFFPWAPAWNQAMVRFVATPFGSHFASFELFGGLRPGVSESSAGLGMALFLLALAALVGAHFYQRRPAAAGPLAVRARALPHRGLRVIPWLLLALFMSQIGTYQNARQLAPFYPFLLPGLLVLPGQTVVVRQRCWQRLVGASLLLTVALVFMARNRPLFPAQTIVTALQARHPHSGLLAKAAILYSSRVNMETLRRAIPAGLPPDEPVVGYAAFWGRSEPWVWLPYGQRRVRQVLPGDSPRQVAAQGIHYVVVEDSILGHERETIAQWAAQFDGQIVGHWDFEREVSAPPCNIYLVHLRPLPGLERGSELPPMPAQKGW